MITSSPGLHKTWNAFERANLAPVETMISLGSYSMPLSFNSLRAIASRKGKMPGVGVYFVFPSNIARCAASITGGGVLKSGSPVLSAMMLFPSARNSAIFALSSNVCDGDILLIRSEIMSFPFISRVPRVTLFTDKQPVKRVPTMPRFASLTSKSSYHETANNCESKSITATSHIAARHVTLRRGRRI